MKKISYGKHMKLRYGAKILEHKALFNQSYLKEYKGVNM